MAKLPEDVAEVLRSPGVVKMLATVDEGGSLNLAPKGSMTVIDDETLAFADVRGGKTNQNLEKRKKVAVGIAKGKEGWQVKGLFQGWETSGPLYDKMSAQIAEKKLGSLKKGVGKIAVTEVWALSIPVAGKKLT